MTLDWWYRHTVYSDDFFDKSLFSKVLKKRSEKSRPSTNHVIANLP